MRGPLAPSRETEHTRCNDDLGMRRRSTIKRFDLATVVVVAPVAYTANVGTSSGVLRII